MIFRIKHGPIPASDYKTGKSVRRALPDAVVKMMESIKETAVSKHVVTPSRHKGPEDDKPPLQPNVALFSAQIIAKAGMKTWSLHDLRRFAIINSSRKLRINLMETTTLSVKMDA